MSNVVLFPSDATTFTTQGLGVLSDVIRCEVTEELNGQFELELDYPVTGVHYEEIELRTLIVCTPGYSRNRQAFRVYSISKPLLGKVTVYARHISYDLSFYVAQPFTSTSLSDACSKLISRSLGTCPFTITADFTKNADMEVKVPTSIRSLMGGNEGSLVDIFGGEWYFDNFTCQLLAERGEDRAVTVRYGKNLTKLDHVDDDTNQVTGVVGYYTYSTTTGEGDQQQTVEHTVTGSVVSTGEYDYIKIMSVDLTSVMNEDETIKKNQEKDTPIYPTSAQVTTFTNTYISQNNIIRPSESISIEFVQLEDVKERVDVGDTVRVNNRGEQYEARCHKTVWDALKERYTNVEVGDARETFSSSMTSSLASTLSGSGGSGLLSARVDSLIANYIETKVLKAGKIDAKFVKTDRLDAKVAEIGYLKASTADLRYATIASLNADVAEINTLIATKATIEDLNAANARIGVLEADYADVSALVADKADIDDLTAATARITSLEANDVTISGNLEAATGRIGNLESDNVVINNNISALSANIENIETNYLQTNDLEAEWIKTDTFQAQQASIDDLETNAITTSTLNAQLLNADNFTAATGRITTLEGDYATINTALSANTANIATLYSSKADIDLANVNNGWITNGTIANAAIGDAMISGVSANKLTAGTIDAANINVANLRASNLIVDYINSQPVIGGYSTVDISQSGYLEMNPSEEGWYEFSNGNFVASSDTAVNQTKVYYISGSQTQLYNRTYIDEHFNTVTTSVDGITTTILTEIQDAVGGGTETITTFEEAAEYLAQTVKTTSDTTNSHETAIQGLTTSVTGLNSQTSTLRQDLDGFVLSVGRTYQTKSDATIVNVLPTVYYDETVHGKEWVNELRGITWTVNADGSVTAKGTADGSTRFLFTHCELEDPVPTVTLDQTKLYFISGCPENGSVNSTYWIGGRTYTSIDDPDGSYGSVFYDEGEGVALLANSKYISVYAQIADGYTCPAEGITFYPMLEVGTERHEYVSTHEGTGALMDRISVAESYIKVEADNIEMQVAELDDSLDGNGIIGRINLNSTTAQIEASNIDLIGAVTIEGLHSTAKTALMASNGYRAVYYRSNSSTTPPITSSTSIGTSDDTDNVWTDRMPRPKKNRYFFTADIYTNIDGNKNIVGPRPIPNLDYTSKWANSNDATYIDGANIYTGSITAAQIAANAVTAEKISVTDLQAIGATIGGFTIDSDAIRSNTKTSVAAGAIALSNSDFSRSINGTTRSLRFAIGGNFGVSNSGVVYANSADLTNVIARTGYIGNGSSGFTLTSTSLYNAKPSIDSGTSGIYIGTDGISLGNIKQYFSNSDSFPSIRFNKNGTSYLYDTTFYKGLKISNFDAVNGFDSSYFSISQTDMTGDMGGLTYRIPVTGGDRFIIGGVNCTATIRALSNLVPITTLSEETSLIYSVSGITKSSVDGDFKRFGNFVSANLNFTATSEAADGNWHALVQSGYYPAAYYSNTSNKYVRAYAINAAGNFAFMFINQGGGVYVYVTAAGTYYFTISYITSNIS